MFLEKKEGEWQEPGMIGKDKRLGLGANNDSLLIESSLVPNWLLGLGAVGRERQSAVLREDTWVLVVSWPPRYRVTLRKSDQS